jgi:phosphatidylglycerophosphatase A
MTLARVIADAGGCGRFPFAPGTFTSLIALIIGAPLLLHSYALAAAVLIAMSAGYWAIQSLHIEDDPSWVVIDEVAGQWVALLGLAHASLPGLLIAFLVFRFLDVVKPGPIGWADRQRGAAGIMADDIIAGAITAGIVWALREHWPDVFDRVVFASA